jgi:hypothetical protein
MNEVRDFDGIDLTSTPTIEVCGKLYIAVARDLTAGAAVTQRKSMTGSTVSAPDRGNRTCSWTTYMQEESRRTWVGKKPFFSED